MIIRFELSTEFTRWEQRLDERNAASTGLKPEESVAPHGLQVAANYRPTGMKPVVAKHRKKYASQRFLWEAPATRLWLFLSRFV